MLHYKVFGEGPVVLFLHGFLESMSMWDHLPLEDFRCRKVFIDLPGHGNSKILNYAEPSIESMANEVISVLEKEGIKKFHIVGHSMGGYIALSIKEKQKECKKVILLNSNYWSDSESKKKDRDRVCKIAFKAKDYFLNEAIPNLFTDKEKYKPQIDQLVDESKQMSPEAIAYASTAMKNRKDKSGVLNKNDIVIIHGLSDTLIKNSDYDLSLINPAHFHNITNAGHMSHIENSGEVIEVLKLYLKD